MTSTRLVLLSKALIFLSAFLLFAIQPMVAKFILPLFGGTYSVWTMSVFFFTTMLLFGYVYASLIISWPKRVSQVVHTGLIAFAALALLLTVRHGGVPLFSGVGEPQLVYPALEVVGILISLIGLATLVLASTSVIVQRMYSNLTGEEPYPLYSLSNAGSLLGLLSYPFLIELWLPLSSQAIFWSGLFSLLVIGLLIMVWQVNPAGITTVHHSESGRPSILWNISKNFPLHHRPTVV